MRRAYLSVSILFLLIAIGLTGGALWTFKGKVSQYLPDEMRSLLTPALSYLRTKLDSGTFMVEMQDGVKLPTKVWKSSENGKHPVVLERGYRPGIGHHAEAFTQVGYVYVGQETRGSLEDNMFFPDAKDGYDCIDWISRQAWCDGNIAMYGRSFYAATQWLVAPEQHANLRAIIPQNVNTDLWEKGYWDHGALQLPMTESIIRRLVKLPPLFRRGKSRPQVGVFHA